MIVAAALAAMLAGADAPVTSLPTAADIDLAVRVCDTWLGDPVTWADHIAQFPKRSGFDRSGLRRTATLPAFAKGIEDIPAAHFWLLETDHAKIAIVTSDASPWCNFALGDVGGVPEASATWTASASAAEHWSVVQDAPNPPGMVEHIFTKPKDGGMPARLLVFSLPASPKKDGRDLQLLATEALQLD